MVALTREMKKLQEGDYTAHLTLRKRDEFTQLKEPFNQWVDLLRKMTAQEIETISQMIQELTTTITQMKTQNASESEILQVNEILNSLKEALNKKQKQITPHF